MHLNQIHTTVLSESWKQNLVAGVFGVAIMFGGVPKAFAANPNDSPTPIEGQVESALSDDQIIALVKELKKDRTPENTKMVLDQVAKSIDAKVIKKEFASAITLISRITSAFDAKTKKELAALKKDLNQQRRDYSEVEKYTKILKSNPAHKTARTALIKIYLLKYDDVENAAKLVGDGMAEKEVEIITQLVLEKNEDLPEKKLLTVAKWYYANGKSEIKALQKAKLYIDKFLKVHTERDAELLEARRWARDIELAVGKIRYLEVKNKIVAKRIPGNVPWNDFMEVKKGDKIRIAASGSYGYWGATNRTGPDGTGKIHYLQGKINYKIFKIGRSHTFVVPEDGILQLGVNDTVHSDNVGGLEVRAKWVEVR